MNVLRKFWNFLKVIGPYVSIIFFISLFYIIPHVYKYRDSLKSIGCVKSYEFLGKNIDCDSSSLDELERMENIEGEIRSIIDESKKQGSISKASVFVRNLENRYWLAIEPDEKYIPASLLKTFIMVAYMRYSLVNKDVLDQEITYDDSSIELNSLDDLIPPEEKLQKGVNYTVLDLLKYMIAYSSNTAAKILIDNIDPKFLDKVYKDFGVVLPQISEGENASDAEFVSTRAYANLYRALYNGNYLTPTYSDLALQFLSQSKFKEGLVGGLPKGIIVAHKFGNRKSQEKDGRWAITLSDCGIVYAKGSDYSICIMTKGYDLHIQESLIQKISEMTYREIGEGK